MANINQGFKHEEMKKRVLFNAAKLFLEKGYTETSLKEIAAAAEINIGSLIHIFKNKENILCELVKYVLNSQFEVAATMIVGKTDDKVLFYAAETALQLYMAESREEVRNLYAAAYTLPNSSAVIQHAVAAKLEEIFKEYLPHLEIKDFYELEIASGGIIRGFMTVPCDMYFTMERKVKRFLETSLRIYCVSDEKISQAIDFVSQFDFETIAKNTINNMLAFLDGKTG